MAHYAPQTTWWVAVNGDQKGPLSTPVLQQWIADGRITPEAFARPSCDAPWTLVKDLRLRRKWPPLASAAIVAAALILLFEVLLLAMANRGAATWGGILLGGYLLAAWSIRPKKKPKK